jgi:hypothetical protein
MQKNIYIDDFGYNESLVVSGNDWPRDEDGRFIKDKKEHYYSKDHSIRRFGRVNHDPIIATTLYNYYIDKPYGALDYGLGPTTFADEDNLIDNAKLKAFNKMADRVRNSGLQLGNDLGESKQTLKMIGDNITRIARAIGSLKRGNFVDAQRLLSIRAYDRRKLPRRFRKKQLLSRYSRQGINGLSSAWLELQFGWKPLLSEIHEGWEIYRNGEENRHTEGVESCNLLKTRSSSSFIISDPFIAGNIKWLRQLKYRVQYRFYYEKTIPNASNTNRKLGLDNPYGVLWEITPWSFFIDYFIPIGDYIAAKEFLNKNPPVVAWKTISRTVSLIAAPSNLSVISIDSRLTTQSVRRAPTSIGELLGGVPFPKPKLFSQVFSTAHVLNSIALLGQMIKGK